MLRCRHKCIVTITKVKHYTRGNNTIPYKLARLVTFESLNWKYCFATNSTLCMKLGPLLYVRCRHRLVKTVRAPRSNKKFLFQLANNADSYGIVKRYRWIQWTCTSEETICMFNSYDSVKNIAFIHVFCFESSNSMQYRPMLCSCLLNFRSDRF